MVSVLADKATAIQAIKNDAQGFLCKPLTAAEINDALTKPIDHRQAVKGT